MNTTSNVTPPQDSTKNPDPFAAVRLMRELLEQFETLTAISDQYGVRTLVDLMYLQQAILTGGYVDAWPAESGLINVLRSLPSVSRWRGYIVAAEPGVDLDALFDDSSTMLSGAAERPRL